MPNPPVHSRARALRRDLTDVERLLWAALRSRQLEFKFRRQHPIPPFIADFACIEARLIVELDGGQHADGFDEQRDAALRAAGWRVIRYWNSDVTANLEGMLADVVGVARLRARR